MLRCYFDESGHHWENGAKHPGKLRHLTLGGCLSTAEKWEAFTVEWLKALSCEDIVMFHMTEFTAYDGEFTKERGWTEERHKQFLNNLLNIIDEYVIAFIGCTFPGVGEDFEEAYEWLAKMNVLYIREALGDQIPDGLTVVLARHKDIDIAPIKNHFEPFFRIMGEPVGIVAEWPKKAVPLQAADFIAYEISHNKGAALYPTDKIGRYPLRRLMTSRKPHLWKIG